VLLTDAGAKTINFPEVGHTATPAAADVTFAYNPSQWVVSGADVGKLMRVDVTATDSDNNVRRCAFTVNVEPAPCQDWALAQPMNGNKVSRPQPVTASHSQSQPATASHSQSQPVTASHSHSQQEGIVRRSIIA
jgi:hypothetical protein